MTRWKDRVEQAELYASRQRPLLSIIVWGVIVALAVYWGSR